jgi:hypothetical protein
VRDKHVDAVLAARRLREAHLAVDSETEERAEAATINETCLAVMLGEAEVRDTVRGMMALLDAQNKGSDRPPFSSLRCAQDRDQ